MLAEAHRLASELSGRAHEEELPGTVPPDLVARIDRSECSVRRAVYSITCDDYGTQAARAGGTNVSRSSRTNSSKVFGQLDPALIRTIELPPDHDLHQRIRFVVAALTDAGAPFARRLIGPEAPALLGAAGFDATH